MNKLPSTGFRPHFGVTCDKSTPGRETNHGIMLLLNVNGVRCAVPVGAPKVYRVVEGEVVGNTASELGNQVLDTLLEYALLDEKCLEQLMGKFK